MDPRTFCFFAALSWASGCAPPESGKAADDSSSDTTDSGTPDEPTDDDRDGDGSLNTDDCAPDNPAIHPGAAEVCNGTDDDCDGLVDGFDDDLVDGITYYRDQDGDGYGDVASTEIACALSAGFSDNAEDCDDTRDAVHPAADEVCGDDRDDDCNGYAEHCLPEGEHPVDSVTVEWTGRAENSFAYTVAACGDLTGDGLPDLMVADLLEAGGTGVDGGVVRVLGWPDSPSQDVRDIDAPRLEGLDSGGWLGTSIACTDFDGDGVEDVVLGSQYQSVDGPDLDGPYTAGAVFWTHGPITGVHTAGILDGGELDFVYAEQQGINVGGNVALGDSTADGIPDLWTSATQTDTHGYNTGTAYLFAGPLSAHSGSAVSAADFMVHGTESSASFADRLALDAGDLDGDGFAELAVGARFSQASSTVGGDRFHGAVTVVSGAVAALGGSLDQTDADGQWIGDPSRGARLADAVRIAPPGLTGDGSAALVVSHGADGAEGVLYILPGPEAFGSGFIGDHPDVVRVDGGERPGGLVGYSLATGGDLTGDGTPDLVVANLTDGESSAVWVIPGPITTSFSLDDATLRLTGDDQTTLGWTVDSRHDLNGDGIDDLAISTQRNGYERVLQLLPGGL